MLSGFETWITERGTEYLLIQLIGVVAAFFGVFSYQCRVRRNIMMMQFVACIFWSVHLSLLGAIAGVVLNCVGAVQRIVYACDEKYAWAKNKLWVPFFILLYIGATAYSWISGDGVLALLPFAGMLLFIFTPLCKKMRTVRILCFFTSPPWLVYNLLNYSIIGTLTECCIMISGIIGYVRNEKSSAVCPAGK